MTPRARQITTLLERFVEIAYVVAWGFVPFVALLFFSVATGRFPPRGAAGTWPFLTLLLLYGANVLIAIVVLRALKRLLAHVAAGEPFHADNSQQLRRMALASIASTVVSVIVELVAGSGLSLSPLLYGALLWVLADVFAVGTSLAEEQSLVV